MTSPFGAVMVTIVLLKVDWMWATPLGTLRFCFLAPVFFVCRAISLFFVASMENSPTLGDNLKLASQK